jgi:hypothetical protein
MDENMPLVQEGIGQVPVVPLPPTAPVSPLPPKPNPLGKIALVLLLFSALTLLGYLLATLGLGKKQVACTMEAKLCSDGTSVGRVAPSCDFAPCPTLSPTPVATADPTANWQTFTDDILSFKYPPAWVKEGKTSLSSADKKIRISIWENETMYNECMEIVEKTENNGLTIKKFKGVFSGEMCSDPTSINNREIWITGKSENQPGIVFYFSESQSVQAEGIFNQILSTFKFLDQKSLIYSNYLHYENSEADFSIEYPNYLLRQEYKFKEGFGTAIFFCETAINLTKDSFYRCDSGGVMVWYNGDGWGGGCDPEFQKSIVVDDQSRTYCQFSSGFGELYVGQREEGDKNEFSIGGSFSDKFTLSEAEKMLKSFKRMKD